MRKKFAKLLIDEMTKERGAEIALLTADMGYGLWDDVKEYYPSRFFNVGSSEQLMVGAAAGMAMEGKIPLCYSITPFVLYRPFEFIRNFMNIEKLPIKLVGGGRNRDYGYLGFTHWAEEDLDVMRQLKNIRTFKPKDETELEKLMEDFLYCDEPCYLNLIK